MANPVLNDKAFERAARADGGTGWAMPDAATRAPYTDGPVSPYQSVTDRMTRGGVATATGVLFVLLLASGWFAWTQTESAAEGQAASIPWFFWAGMLGGLALAILTAFKPTFARVTAPLYALAQGLFVGVISKLFNDRYDGIVLQAVLATGAVFAVMWFLYATRVIKVTAQFRRAVVGATLGVVVLALANLVQSLVTDQPGFMWSNGTLGIVLSLVIIGIAAMNLALDFDLIDRGTESGAPKHMEWYAAFGLMVTLVWLYLEILRLLAKLRQR